MKKTFFLISALIIPFLSGCTDNAGNSPAVRDPKSEFSRLTPRAIPNVSSSAYRSRTFFRFSEAGTVFMRDGEEKQIQILVTPEYEPVTSVQVGFRYDPEKLSIKDISAAEGIMVFQKTADTGDGEVLFVGGAPEGLFGKSLPLMSFTVSAVPGAKGESPIAMIPEHLHALLPDAANTDTAYSQNIKPLVLSIL